ncbi:MAG: APC family permease [Gammaproteobacteria bacterium]|nr:APC family permease [Gammaproteobacteria bacterium]
MLKRDISRTNVLIVAAGSMIGSGWLFSPFISAQMAGSHALFAWVIAAVFMILIALPLCELGTMFPISGGMVNYPNYTHGLDVGFLFAWISWLSYVVTTPIEVQAILQYASHFFPQLIVTIGENGFELSYYGYVVAIAVLLFVVLLNSFGIKLLAECNRFTGIIKFIVPTLATVALISTAPTFHNIQFNVMDKHGWEMVFSALSTGGIIFAFAGFQNGLVLAGEVENPQTNIPIAILGAVGLGFLIYFTLQLSFLMAVPPELLTHGWQHLTFPDASAPLVGLTLLVGLGWVATILLIDASFSPFGSALVYTTATSRILYGMALNKHLPSLFLKVNRYGIPTRTLWANFIVGALSFLPFPGWQKMVAFLSSCSILSYSIGPICLLAMRELKPDQLRPFRLWFATPICYLAFYVCNLMLYWCGFDILIKLNIGILIGGILHFTYQQRFEGLKEPALYWFILYLLTLLLISYCGNFGGMKLISFPLDLFILFPVSCVFLYSACHVKMERGIDERIASSSGEVIS